jgi:hypothetical protein
MFYLCNRKYNFCVKKCDISLPFERVTHNCPEKAKPERYQWKKPEWNKAESIWQKEQARIFINRIGLRQNASTEQGRISYKWKNNVFCFNHFVRPLCAKCPWKNFCWGSLDISEKREPSAL